VTSLEKHREANKPSIRYTVLAAIDMKPPSSFPIDFPFAGSSFKNKQIGSNTLIYM
jgi:hypothetical protein